MDCACEEDGGIRCDIVAETERGALTASACEADAWESLREAALDLELAAFERVRRTRPVSGRRAHAGFPAAGAA